MFGERTGEMPNLTVLGMALMWSYQRCVVYHIQKSARAKPKVIHADRLKPYLGPPLERWIPKRQTQLLNPREKGREVPDVNSLVFVEGEQ